MKRKLFKKLFFSTAVIVIVCLIFMMAILSFVINNYLSQERRELLLENSKTISAFMTESMKDRDYLYNVSGIMQVVARAIDAEIFVVDADGEVFACTCREWGERGYCAHSQKKIPEAIMRKAVEQEYFEIGNLAGRYSEAYYTTGIPLYSATQQDTAIGAVFASSPTASVRTFIGRIFSMFVVAAICALAVMFLVLYLFTYRLTKPLHMMSVAAYSMAQGDFSRRIPVTGDDEISELAIAFNQMTNSLVQLEKMRRSFVANVSHELKTPMTTIGGFIDGIIDGTIEPEKQSYYLQIVSGEVKRLSRLVQSMLNLAKLESGELKLNPQTFDLTQTLYDIVIAQEQRIEKKQIQIGGLDTLPACDVCADRDLIHQVLYNLVDNAVKFTDTGGLITFSLENLVTGRVRFKIRNSGLGIDADDLPYVFERFYKTDRSRSMNPDSTGLGLYLVKTITDVHGGSIMVRSKQNEFTEFELELPRDLKNLDSGGRLKG